MPLPRPRIVPVETRCQYCLEKDAEIQRLLAALRRESFHWDTRAKPSGYETVILKKETT